MPSSVNPTTPASRTGNRGSTDSRECCEEPVSRSSAAIVAPTKAPEDTEFRIIGHPRDPYRSTQEPQRRERESSEIQNPPNVANNQSAGAPSLWIQRKRLNTDNPAAPGIFQAWWPVVFHRTFDGIPPSLPRICRSWRLPANAGSGRLHALLYAWILNLSYRKASTARRLFKPGEEEIKQVAQVSCGIAAHCFLFPRDLPLSVPRLRNIGPRKPLASPNPGEPFKAIENKEQINMRKL